ncbi:Kinesin-like protein KIN-12F [Camellia lanceoleosa]|uniref:Kinesin-like protein KIN-12F n=1 Tax=Camellia lanceoleosa TaxID=1840588 RepID=A0ACC0GLR1_9ERIC|nr:Kinesin-like protein KIN-12F [Camellia lanceoleosa]
MESHLGLLGMFRLTFCVAGIWSGCICQGVLQETVGLLLYADMGLGQLAGLICLGLQFSFASAPEFEDDPHLYVLKAIKYVGIEVWQCRCSFLEIRDDTKHGFYVENLTEEYVTSYEDITQILIKGLSSRKVGATSIHSESSQSHIVFTCVIESWCKV